MTRTLTPTPDEARTLIAYHERILKRTTSGDRRLRSERAIARLREWCTDNPPGVSGSQGSPRGPSLTPRR